MSFALELVILFIISSLIGYSVLSLIEYIWRRYSILDRPDRYKTEAGRAPAPYGVGVAIVFTLLISAIVIPFLFDISASLEKKLYIILSLTSIIAFVSFLDDLDTIGKSRW
jgi:UDP-N-acetylmuramyl pentapeptide phosphotransferase/UDP-N-acetylglucosamine-1-phosphate transferase